MKMHDLIIRGATLVDGTGSNPRVADVAVQSGRVSAIGQVSGSAAKMIDADGLVLAPGIVDLHTHYDAQVTWDRTLSPSPSLGVTTAVMGNCGFGIVPSPPSVRDLILRNLSVVEGMDLDALREGVQWDFESFPDYMTALRDTSPYLNVAVLAGHSVIRTAVMGEAASEQKEPSPKQLARMQAMVAEAMANGAVGLGSSYSLNHSGYGGVPMPSTISDLGEFEALVSAMGDSGHGVVQVASGARSVEELADVSRRHGRAIFLTSGVAMYNDQAPERGIGVFDSCASANAKGSQVYVQIPCQPLSFDFTLANAYPFYSHEAFSEIKAYEPKQLKQAFADSSFRDRFRNNLANVGPGMIFQGNWDRITVAVPALEKNNALANQTIAELASQQARDPLDVMLDLALEEDLATTFIGRFLNVGDEGVGRLLQHEAGVVALSDAGAHLVFMCDAGFGLHFLSHWVRDRGEFSLSEGVRRLTSHPADFYGISDRGRIAMDSPADFLLFDADRVGVSAPERVNDLPGGGRRTIRHPVGVHGVYVNGVEVYGENGYACLDSGPGQVLDRFSPSRNNRATT
jgi:N-acyl-D-amino-acid deacylase